MKNKKILTYIFNLVLTLSGLSFTGNTWAQLIGFSNTEVIFSENFNTEIPGDFIVLDRDEGISGFTDYQDTTWFCSPISGGFISVVSHFTNSTIPADDWIILPAVTIPDSAYIYWEAWSEDPTYPEKYEVLISTTEPDPDAFNPAQFTLLTTIVQEKGNTTGHSINLDNKGYAGETVWIAFHCISKDKYILNMDNFYVFVPRQMDYRFAECNPNVSVHAGEELEIFFTLYNYGQRSENIKLCWQAESDADIHEETISGISYGESCHGSFTSRFISTTPGEKSVKAWIDELDGNPDVNQDNDTNQFYVEVINNPVPRKILVEEFTGTWCGFCPEGALFLEVLMDSIPEVLPVVIHAYDSMEIPEGAEVINSFGGGLPTAILNRFYFQDGISQGRSQWITSCNYMNNNVPVSVEIMADASFSDADSMITADIITNFTQSKSGDFRFNLYVVEDSITGYPQHSYFNSDPLSAFYQLGNPIENYVHKHILRKMAGGAWGEQGTHTNPALGKYSHTFSFKADTSWDMDQISFIATVSEYNFGSYKCSVINAVECDLSYYKLYTQTDELVSNNITINANPSVSEASYAFKVKNMDTLSADTKISFERLEGNRDHNQYICWDNCYPNTVFETGMVTISPDTFSIFPVSLHIEPNGMAGTDKFLLTIYNVNDPTKKKELYLTFVFGTEQDIFSTHSDESLDNIDIFPNPSDGLINVSFINKEAASATLRISVISPLGQLLYFREDFADPSGRWTGTMDLSNLPGGIYYYTLETAGIKETGKFIITR